MALYKDLLSGDEVLNSYFDTKDIDDVVYEAEGAFVTIKDENNFNTGANASAENPDEEGFDDPSARQEINIVNNFRLEKAEGLCPDKKAFGSVLKGYLGRLAKKLKENGKTDEEIAAIDKGIKSFAANTIGKTFKEWEFYTGQSSDPEAMVVMCRWKDNSAGKEAPFFYVWKHGVRTEKI